MPFIIGLICALLGGLLEQESGFVFGGLLGFGAALVWQLRARVMQLERRIDAIAGDARPEPARLDAALPARAVGEQPAAAPSPTDASPTAAPRAARPAPAKTVAREPSAVDKLIDRLGTYVKNFFTTGNLVVRIGVVVLFFGVAFLLRYAYEYGWVPVELRLMGAGIGGMALAGFGWRVRQRSDTYGLILQGAGVGILYLTIFSSAKLYALLPLPAALALLVALVAASCVLAVVQRSQPLAVFSMSGGFLAPVLLSTGAGSHVALFTYYAVLNAGILSMAWFRYWRGLNWIGFVFTFAIGATWGWQYYRPEYFVTTEPFLILFFGYYLGVSVLFARRKDVELRGLVDGTLVFGTPIIAFALQAALVADMEFGLAFSALGAAAVYTVLAIWLKRLNAFANLLGQTFAALAVVFATLVIPFGFDNQRFTAASWALEGAGLVWVGVRQAQLLPRAFGLFLQLAAAVAFLAELGAAVEPTLFLNSAFLGAALLSLAGTFTAYVISRHMSDLRRFEAPLRWLFLGWSVVWWFAGGLHELERYRPSGYGQYEMNNLNENLFALFAALSLAALTLVAKHRKWTEALVPGFLLLPIALLTLVGLDLYWQNTTTLADLGWVAWPVVLLALAWHLRQVDSFRVMASFWHAGFWWFVTLFVTWNVAALVFAELPDSIWSGVLWGAIPLAGTAMLLRLQSVERWPFADYWNSYFGWGWAAAMGYLMGWLVLAGLQPADPAPLPYLVFVNPLELVQLGVLLVAMIWVGRLSRTPLASAEPPARIALGAVAFVWINLTAARAVHFYGAVAYPLAQLAESDAFQTTVSILWTVIALGLMGFGARAFKRVVWIVGAVLLGLVIVKLFTVDLGNLDMVARIITFITVGLLMLVIGYFAPLPTTRSPQAGT